MTEYVSHLAADTTAAATFCGEPWQGWQAPFNLDLLDPKAVTLPPQSPPRPHLDRIRFCGACAKRFREYAPPPDAAGERSLR